MSSEPEGAPLQFVWERQYHDRVKPARGSPSRPPGEASRRRAIEGAIWTGWACREPEELCQARVARRLNMIFSAAMQSFVQRGQRRGQMELSCHDAANVTPCRYLGPT